MKQGLERLGRSLETAATSISAFSFSPKFRFAPPSPKQPSRSKELVQKIELLSIYKANVAKSPAHAFFLNHLLISLQTPLFHWRLGFG